MLARRCLLVASNLRSYPLREGGWLTVDPSRLVNLAVAVIMVLGGIAQFFPISLGAAVVGVYVIIFGLGMFAFDAPSVCFTRC